MGDIQRGSGFGEIHGRTGGGREWPSRWLSACGDSFCQGPEASISRPSTLQSSSRSGLFLAVVFSIFAFNGWESVAPLAEESENPRRNLPRAMFISILVTGGFLVLGAWGLLVGWGTERLPDFINSPENPTFVLARHYWGGGWVLVLLALLNSVIAASIAANNGATRVWFGMAPPGRCRAFWPRCIRNTKHPSTQSGCKLFSRLR